MQFPQNLWSFARSTSGALIIGLSLIVALNFERFIGWGDLAYYHFSGQAAADRATEERKQVLAELERLSWEQQRAEKEEQARQKQKEWDALRDTEERHRITLFDAWLTYLTANRSGVKQIDVVRDTEHGDYACLRIVYGTLAATRYSDFVIDKSKEKARDQMVAAWTYELRDRVAEGFVQWLNNNKLSNKIDWQHNDLKDMNFYSKIMSFKLNTDLHDPMVMKMNNCLLPNDLWRANRFQRRVD